MKIPKAKCEKCKHCKLIDGYGNITCDVTAIRTNTKKPKRCLDFLKMGGKQNAR